MPSVLELESAPRKGHYLLTHLQPALYEELSGSPLDRRQKLVEALALSRFTYDFPALIRLLAKHCFDVNQSLFIRAGASDFLGDLLQHIVSLRDKEKITDASYITTYEPHQEVVELFFILNRVASSDYPAEYQQLLSKNLILKIFNPLAINAVMDGAGAVQENAAVLQGIIGNEKLVAGFFDSIVRLRHDDFYQPESESYHQLTELKSKILTTPWKIDRRFIVFQGGETVTVEGRAYRLPLRVAAVLNHIISVESRGILPSEALMVIHTLNVTGLTVGRTSLVVDLYDADTINTTGADSQVPSTNPAGSSMDQPVIEEGIKPCMDYEMQGMLAEGFSL